MIFDRYRWYFFLSIQLEELDIPEEAKHYFCTRLNQIYEEGK